MAWTQADLDAINKAIASGAKRVTFSDHTVEYHSMDDMLKAKNLIESELNGSTVPPIVQSVAFSTR